MIHVAIVEDDVDIREAIQEYLGAHDEFVCEPACESMEDFFEVLDEKDLPDVVLCDIGLPGMSGIDGIRQIKSKYPEINLIMLTIYHDSHKIFESLRAGASGYLLKNTPLDEITKSIEVVKIGGSPMSPQIARKVIDYFNPVANQSKTSTLTARELDIVNGLVDGLSYKLIGVRLSISIETVRYHIKNIYEKLHVHSKAEVISKSLKGEI